jgi:hypothetical protein
MVLNITVVVTNAGLRSRRSRGAISDRCGM